MLTNRRTGFIIVAVVLSTCVFRALDVWGAMVVAEGPAGWVPGIGAGVGTHDLLAYSYDPGPPVTENAFRNDSFLALFPPGAVIRFGDEIRVGWGPFARIYQPPVGFRGRPKGALAFVRSASPGPVAGAADGLAAYGPPVGPLPATVAATAVAPAAGQKAAAEAIDPVELPAGIYQYEPLISEISLRLDGLPDEFAGVTFFARDSRFDESLWELGVAANGVLASQSDLLIDFVSQPLLGLDDAMIEGQIRNAFSVGGSTATLSSYTLFSTTYNVSETIQFAEGLNAGASSVIPEPSAMILLCIGLFSVSVGQRRR